MKKWKIAYENISYFVVEANTAEDAEEIFRQIEETGENWPDPIEHSGDIRVEGEIK